MYLVATRSLILCIRTEEEFSIDFFWQARYYTWPNLIKNVSGKKSTENSCLAIIATSHNNIFLNFLLSKEIC